MLENRFVQAGLAIVASVAGFGGLAFLVVAAYYLWWYYAEPANPYRNEVQAGVLIGLVYALPFWLVALLCWQPVRTTVPPWVASSARRLVVIAAVAYVGLLLYEVGRAWGA